VVILIRSRQVRWLESRRMRELFGKLYYSVGFFQEFIACVGTLAWMGAAVRVVLCEQFIEEDSQLRHSLRSWKTCVQNQVQELRGDV